MTADENGRKILLVEDDADLRAAIAENLESNGFSVICASRGRCAGVLAQRFVPDIALVDLGLPDMDGVKLCKDLNENKLLGSVPVIVISANVSLQHRIRSFMSGARKYLAKPFDFDELMEAIEYFMSRKATNRGEGGEKEKS